MFWYISNDVDFKYALRFCVSLFVSVIFPFILFDSFSSPMYVSHLYGDYIYAYCTRYYDY